MIGVELPPAWPTQRGYVLEVLPAGEHAVTVKVTYPPKPKRTTRMKYRMKRYLRLVVRAGVESIQHFTGAPVNAETRDAILDVMLPALRKAGERYRHLKT
jgi:hypothetical protein